MGSRARGPVAALTETGCSDAPLLPLNTDAPKKASKIKDLRWLYCHV